jgi:Putative prokaryotic signal transducing protein
MAKSPEHPKHVIVVASAENEMEAGVMVAALEEAGIKSTMSGAATADFRVGVPGDVQILVAEADEAKAREIIRLGEENKEGVDWSQVDVGEPEDE